MKTRRTQLLRLFISGAQSWLITQLNPKHIHRASQTAEVVAFSCFFPHGTPPWALTSPFCRVQRPISKLWEDKKGLPHPGTVALRSVFWESERWLEIGHGDVPPILTNSESTSFSVKENMHENVWRRMDMCDFLSGWSLAGTWRVCTKKDRSRTSFD